MIRFPKCHPRKSGAVNDPGPTWAWRAGTSFPVHRLASSSLPPFGASERPHRLSKPALPPAGKNQQRRVILSPSSPILSPLNPITEVNSTGSTQSRNYRCTVLVTRGGDLRVEKIKCVTIIATSVLPQYLLLSREQHLAELSR
jgi:hypothetical protein